MTSSAALTYAVSVLRQEAFGRQGKPMALELARRDIIRRDVLKLHGRYGDDRSERAALSASSIGVWAENG